MSILPHVYETLSEFVHALEQAGELKRIRVPVSPMLEIAALSDMQAKAACPNESEHARRFDPGHCRRGGKALLFESVEGSDFPVLINAYGSYRRTEMALGCAGGGFEAIASKLAAIAKPEPPKSFRDLLRKGRQFLPLLRAPPRLVRQGLCQEVVRRGDDINLFRLPLIQCWPLDGDPAAVGAGMTAEEAGTAKGEGRYLTFAGIHTIHADDEGAEKPSSHNVGMYRLQLVDRKTLVMHWHMHHDGAAHWRSWKRKGKPMPVAICLGGEGVLPYAATAPLPPGMSELLLAGFLNRRGIPMVRAKTVPLRVPANSEIVIEGWVDTMCGPIGYDPRTGEALGPGAAFEGPFGDHTGFYSLPDRYPLVQVSAITHQKRAVYPTTIVGPPPQEDYYLGKATERIFLPLLRTIVHDIVDYHLPLFGCFHNCAFVKIRKEYPLQARRVMHAIWGAGQMAWTKFIVVVDGDVDVHDEEAVWRAVFANCDFGKDLEGVRGPLDILDHAAPRLGAGGKLGIDATRKIAGEEAPAPRTPKASPAPAGGELLPTFAQGRLAFVSVDKHEAGDGGRAIEAAWERTGADFVIAVDLGANLADPDDVFFRWCANTDPGRDLHARGGRIGFDATRKVKGDERHGQPVRDYPPPLVMSEEVKRLVRERWEQYGLGR
ncbi:MAG TPA: UbiD family decarboxylase [Planctomycetota bacterium]|nr:UbiD family decarboxylase [Planctomycetota bacterium]